ncbi:hypothetical protein HJC23_009420 [Cyclotella cryptica]|uniref:Methyltransferase domain-containing protein n=1 Tax=Cyclotella cryptica TaxID=29204 RepID=A0ABD3PXZ1_9STRA
MQVLSIEGGNKDDKKSMSMSLSADSKPDNEDSLRADGRKGNSSSTRHGARNQHRHKHFTKWLISKFPHILTDCVDNIDHHSPDASQNPKPMHILDVAGGKGELSARLSLCHALRVVMVDPRSADVASVYMNSVVPKLPNKWQASIRQQIQQCPTFVGDLLERRYSQLVMPFTAPVNLDSDTCEQRRDLFERNVPPLLHDAVQRASLIIGLHADSATEAIVDAALLYNKPFVVVPCCVFPNLFNNRYIDVPIQDAETGVGTQSTRRIPVRTHEHFCVYLLNKDSRFKREILPFEGRNVAIWWDGM